MPQRCRCGQRPGLLLVLRQCELPIWERLRPWDTADLPLATDLVEPEIQWDRLGTAEGRKPAGAR
ncbi:hypothetical protein [Synechococcus sp. CS-205]|uniref:hypothetical protein n=1 Tax=Synechococcus sp. CS-205 TaxID=2847984 RepID=UPI00223A702B|nr:hypothetical protein [Synechococcus sp. CS-205]MCT0248176.1 hypothetical protein [Synechococcus sp. CS-205]